MFAKVVQHVHERVAHFPRRAQQARVISVSPHSSSAPQRAIHRLRHADREPAYTTLELRRRIRLYQQMHMIGLNADMERPVNAFVCVCEGEKEGASSRAVDVDDDGSL